MLAQILARDGCGRLLALLLLLGCGGTRPDPYPIYPLTLPDCMPGQFLAIGDDRSLECATLFDYNIKPPVCPAGTHALSTEGGQFVCAEKGIGTTNSQVAAALRKATTGVALIDTQIYFSRDRVARYCGQTTSSLSGRFAAAGVTGIATVRNYCAQLASCGSGGRLCSVYEMYESVAAGLITDAMNIDKSWVYMASWALEFSDNSGTQEEPGAGLADNCGSYTSSDSTKKWYGTAVQWASADGGPKALKFYSGPDTVGIPGTTMQVTNPGAVPCGTMLPAACCR